MQITFLSPWTSYLGPWCWDSIRTVFCEYDTAWSRSLATPCYQVWKLLHPPQLELSSPLPCAQSWSSPLLRFSVSHLLQSNQQLQHQKLLQTDKNYTRVLLPCKNQVWALCRNAPLGLWLLQVPLSVEDIRQICFFKLVLTRWRLPPLPLQS